MFPAIWATRASQRYGTHRIVMRQTMYGWDPTRASEKCSGRRDLISCRKNVYSQVRKYYDY